MTLLSRSRGSDKVLMAHLSDEQKKLISTEKIAKVNKAVVFCCQGKLDAAHKDLIKIYDELPLFVPVLRCLIYVLIRKGLHREALKVLRESNGAITKL